jgi:hypothetical protein
MKMSRLIMILMALSISAVFAPAFAWQDANWMDPHDQVPFPGEYGHSQARQAFLDARDVGLIPLWTFSDDYVPRQPILLVQNFGRFSVQVPNVDPTYSPNGIATYGDTNVLILDGQLNGTAAVIYLLTNKIPGHVDFDRITVNGIPVISGKLYSQELGCWLYAVAAYSAKSGKTLLLTSRNERMNYILESIRC